MNLYVPVPGDRLKLTSDWTFTVHSDHNNWWLINALGLPHVRTQQCTLPAGTKLAVSYWNVEGNRKHWDHVVLRLLERTIDFSVGTSDIGLIDCDVSKPTYRPRRALGDWFDYENDLNEYLLDEEEETDWEKVWADDDNDDEEDISDEDWDDIEDGWDDSFYPTIA